MHFAIRIPSCVSFLSCFFAKKIFSRLFFQVFFSYRPLPRHFLAIALIFLPSHLHYLLCGRDEFCYVNDELFGVFSFCYSLLTSAPSIHSS